jgi:hypothetical protein
VVVPHAGERDDVERRVVPPSDVFHDLDQSGAIAVDGAAMRRRIVVAREEPRGIDGVLANDGEQDIHRRSRGLSVDRHSELELVDAKTSRDRAGVAVFIVIDERAHARGDAKAIGSFGCRLHDKFDKESENRVGGSALHSLQEVLHTCARQAIICRPEDAKSKV